MAHDIALALWFFLPAGIANVTPIFVAKLPVLKQFNVPIDGGRMYRGKRLLGDHKTWRGLIAGLMLGVATMYVQSAGYAHVSWIRSLSAPVDYQQLALFPLGLMFGFGALGGDAVKSFFKRRRSIPAGETWIPFDQADLIIGAILATAPIVTLPWTVYLWGLALWPAIQLLSTILGYLLGLKESPL